MEQIANHKQAFPTPEEIESMKVIPAFIVNLIAFVLQVLIYGLPFLVIIFPFIYIKMLSYIILWIILSPIIYVFLFGILAGLLSIPFQRGIVKGVFPRDVRFPVYALRKLYGICWTSVYYFKPIYNIILSVSFYKRLVFRLFGYKGSLKITIFPDAWIRDLPLLRIEDGAYIANRATIGTNICLKDGNIMVGSITLMKGSIVGHLSKVGIGFRLGENSEVGVGCQIGLHTKIGSNSNIGGMSGIGHFAKIGDNVEIGIRSFIGNKAIIANNLILPSNCNVPDGVIVETQSDVLKYI